MITERIAIQGSACGTQHELTVFRFGRPGARPMVYIQGALHADEIPGMACAAVLRRRLAVLEADGAVRGEIVLVPVANPIGLGQAVLGSDIGRFDVGNGGNFNRDYPALGPALVERIGSRLTDDAGANVALARTTLAAILEEAPALTPAEQLKKTLLGTAIPADLVLDLHCDSEAAVHLYTTNAAAPVFAPLAARLGALAVLLADVSGGDPFDEALSRPWLELAQAHPDKPVPAGCHATTVELRGQADVTPALAEADAAAIVGFLHDAGVLAGPGRPAPAPLYEATPLAASEPLLAPVGGILAYRAEPGALVHAGDVVAEITDPLTGAVTTVPSPCDGVLFARSASRFTRPGRRLGKVAGRVAQRSGKLLSP